MINKIKYIFLLFFLIKFYLMSESGGIGDLNIEVIVTPVGKVKKYDIDDKVVLDAGIINSSSRISIKEKIATVLVKMRTQQKNNEDIGIGNSYGCIIEGEFSPTYDLSMFEKNSLTSEVYLSELKKYYKGNEVNLKLIENNFKILMKEVKNEDLKENEYSFSAYPEECYENTKSKNILKYLEYSFDLELEVNNIESGTIVGSDVLINNDLIDAAVGSAQDLVKGHFLKMQR